ncbi:helix-turn-helix domain-containing protein [Streptomyces tendae]|uniref:helix-turn-helix domain-containing protein n=1 Tax=Streptomyces tendae TaxID=1932 RepID=UPI00365F5982
MDDSDPHPLTAARRARGLSQTTLAILVRQAAARRGLRSGCDRPRIRKWERGVVPDADSQLYLAEALGLPPEAVAIPWPHCLHNNPDGVVLLTQRSAVPALREALTPVERRTFLTLSGVGLTGLAGQWASAPSAAALDVTTGPPGTGENLIGVLRDSVDGLTAAGPAHEQHTTKLLAAHLDTVTDMLETGGHCPATLQRLHDLAADLAHILAWRHFDRGAHPVDFVGVNESQGSGLIESRDWAVRGGDGLVGRWRFPARSGATPARSRATDRVIRGWSRSVRGRGDRRPDRLLVRVPAVASLTRSGRGPALRCGNGEGARFAGALRGFRDQCAVGKRESWVVW